MDQSNSIAPFPPSINRDSFGNWLSGFVDGEGYFITRISTDDHGGKRKHPTSFRNCVFGIGLRHDDAEVLSLIQSFLQCGIIKFCRRLRQNGHPQTAFMVNASADLDEIVVPHFERYPLHAKKQRDFLLWKQAVAIQARVGRIKHWSRQRDSGKWSAEDKDEFARIHLAIKGQRAYAPKERLDLFGHLR